MPSDEFWDLATVFTVGFITHAKVPEYHTFHPYLETFPIVYIEVDPHFAMIYALKSFVLAFLNMSSYPH